MLEYDNVHHIGNPPGYHKVDILACDPLAGLDLS